MLHSIRQRGFTLIELMVVIAVVGVLAMMALPRFSDMSPEAHKAAMTNIAGQFQSSLNMARLNCVAGNRAGLTAAEVGATDNINFFPNCVPGGQGTDVVTSYAMTNPRLYRVITGIMNSSYTIGYGTTPPNAYASQDLRLINQTASISRIIYCRDADDCLNLDYKRYINYDWQNGTVASVVNP